MIMMIIYCPLVASLLGTRVRGIGVSDLTEGRVPGGGQTSGDLILKMGSGRLPPGLYI